MTGVSSLTTPSMENHIIEADAPSGEEIASKSTPRLQEPQGRNDRFLTLFAVATVATIPAAILIGLGYYLDYQEILFVGVVFFLIASAFWLVAYLTVAWWMVSDGIYFIGKFVESTFKSGARRNPLE